MNMFLLDHLPPREIWHLLQEPPNKLLKEHELMDNGLHRARLLRMLLNVPLSEGNLLLEVHFHQTSVLQRDQRNLRLYGFKLLFISVFTWQDVLLDEKGSEKRWGEVFSDLLDPLLQPFFIDIP